jgi:hypothetical protein
VCRLRPKQFLNACSRRAALRRERLENCSARPNPQETKAGRRRNRKKRRDQYVVAVPRAREIKDVRGTPLGEKETAVGLQTVGALPLRLKWRVREAD